MRHDWKGEQDPRRMRTPEEIAADLVCGRLDRIEEIVELKADLAKALERVDVLEFALDSIACFQRPDADQDQYWLELSHAFCAEVIARDTRDARAALEKGDA